MKKLLVGLFAFIVLFTGSQALADNSSYTGNGSSVGGCSIDYFNATPSPVVIGQDITLSYSTTGCNYIFIDNQYPQNGNAGIASEIIPAQGQPGIQSFALSAAATILPGCHGSNGYAGYGVDQTTPCSSTAQYANIDVTVIDKVLDGNLLQTTPTSDLTPRISYWYGKVNQHVDVYHGYWTTDTDGTSGANLDKLTYCQKFYPNTVRVEEYSTETLNSWYTAGNTDNYTSTKPTYKCIEGTTAASKDAYVNLVSPQSGSTFKAGQSVRINIDSNLTRNGAFRSLIYKKDGNRYVYVKNFDTPYAGVQTLQLPSWTPAGEYRIDYGHIMGNDAFTQYGTATFYVTSDTKDNGCSNGEVYSSTTGQKCFSGDASINVYLPKEGDVYKVGQNILVKWVSKNVVARVIGIMLIGNGNSGAITTLSVNTANDGTEVVALPNITGNNFRILITNDQTGGGYSKVFTIVSENTDLPSGCTSTSKYSSTTGLPCNGSGNSNIRGCKPGFNFSPITGEKCPSTYTPNPTIPQTTSVAQCLKNKGATLYGTFWCPHCQSQKALFGAGASIVPYVECSNPDSTQTQACIDKNITGYPTWIFADGTRLEGEQSLLSLSDKANCSNLYSTTGSSATTTPITRTLKVGVKGDDVKALQAFLNLLADGSYGPKTASKVMEWQAANGLTPDGAFGNASRQKAFTPTTTTTIAPTAQQNWAFGGGNIPSAF